MTVGSRPRRFATEVRVIWDGVVVVTSDGIADGPLLLALGGESRGAHADENDDAGNKSKGVGRYAKQSQPILNYCQQDNTKYCSDHRPDSALQASAAQADGRDVVYFKTSLQKIYKDGEEWKTTTSLGRDDLPVARLLMQQAWEFILEAERPAAKDEAET